MLHFLFFLSPFPHLPLTTLKCFQYDWQYQTCLGLSFMLCTSSLLSPDLFSCDFTITCKMFLPESLGKKVCTGIYPGKACDRKVIVLLAWEAEVWNCSTLEQELQSLLLILQLLLWPAAYCWDSGTSQYILYAHHVKKCFIAE